MQKEQMKNWLDNMIEAHKPIWAHMTYPNTDGIEIEALENTILTKGVVKAAEILGCAVTFDYDGDCTRICMEYRGVEFVEHKFH